MTLQQLEYIIALDEHRHYVTAAENCFVSQPNLTMQIKKLEEEIGVKIFDRDKKPLQPTEIGREVITRARQILYEARQLKEFVHHEKESMEGEYRIGIIPTLAPYLMPRLLPRFIKENPRVYLKIQELQTEEIIARLESGMLDIGILVTPLHEGFIKEYPVFYEPFLVYLPEGDALMSRTRLQPEDLVPDKVLILDKGHCFREQTLSICSHPQHGASVGFDYQSGSIEVLKNLVQNGVGYTLVPELSVLKELDAPHIKRFQAPEPVREVSLVVHSNFIKESVINRLIETIRGVVPDTLLTRQAVVEIKE